MMSTELETLLRDAAGPVPALDLDTVRRRARRRRRVVRAAGAVSAGALAGVAALGLAVLPGPGARGPVVDDPIVGAPSEPSGHPAGPAEADPRFEIVDDEGCTLRFVEGGQVRADAPLDGPRGAVLCSSAATAGDVRAQEMLFAETGGPPGRGDGVRRVVGVLDGEVAEVELLLRGGDRILVRTHLVATPGSVPVAGYVAEVPDVGQVRSVTAFDAAGEWLFERTPDRHLHRPDWRPAGPPADEPTDRVPVSEAAPIDDLPVELPDDVPPFGSWRPDRSPVDLAPLSMRDTGDAWYLDAGEPSGLASRGSVADRLGDEEGLAELCTFFVEQRDVAHEEVDLEGERAEPVHETLVHLVLRQEGIHGGDGLTVAVTGACGLSERTDAGATATR
jgi:hypothetical protein